MNNNSNDFEVNDNFDIIKEFFKYLFFWKYFLFSLLFFLSIAFVVVRYSDRIVETTAKIQILDKKQTSLEMPSAEDLFSSSKINLENELEVIKSTSLLEKVVRNLNLTNLFEGVGNIVTSLVVEYPFEFKSKIHIDSITQMSFNLELRENDLKVQNLKNGKEYFFKSFTTIGSKHDLPFEIFNIKKEKWFDLNYNINFSSVKSMVSFLKKSIVVSKVGKQSDIISIAFNSTNSQFSINVINELLDVFNNDGVEDRQLIHKRTIDFVNSRYLYLSSVLDSIEIDKKIYKVKNNLVRLEANSAISLEKSSIYEESVFSNENQIFIVSNLLSELSKLNFELLPSNIGVESIKINSLINSYNNLVLEQRKFILSAGPNNPSVIQMNNLIVDSRSSIILSLKNHLLKLNTFKEKLLNQSSKYNSQISQIPEQEKQLRSIERNQKIKEALYLFLLQKREEAEVSYAITEPSIKVVEYALSNDYATFPNIKMIYSIALILGLLFPFLFLYLLFFFDNKIHSKEDIESSNFTGDVIGEIPFFDLDEKDKLFSDPNSRSIVSEAFRMVMSNLKYLLKSTNESQVILVTSSIKGEGKTLTALNLSLAFASLNKKVLLVGCDLRNPQVHKYINEDKNTKGVVNFLVDNNLNWEESILKSFPNQPSHNIMLSGSLPPNPLNLINNGNLDILIKKFRENYDYIFIDSAPTILVADTKSMFHLADTILYLTRCNVTDKEVLNHIQATSKDTPQDVSILLNGVGEKDSYGYSYGYQYGYGYNYQYKYNYGYGYGYKEDKD